MDWIMMIMWQIVLKTYMCQDSDSVNCMEKLSLTRDIYINQENNHFCVIFSILYFEATFTLKSQ